MDILKPLDFDFDFSQDQNTVTNYQKLFGDIIDHKHLITRRKKYQNKTRNMEKLRLDIHKKIPFDCLFHSLPDIYKLRYF